MFSLPINDLGVVIADDDNNIACVSSWVVVAIVTKVSVRFGVVDVKEIKCLLLI